MLNAPQSEIPLHDDPYHVLREVRDKSIDPYGHTQIQREYTQVHLSSWQYAFLMVWNLLVVAIVLLDVGIKRVVNVSSSWYQRSKQTLNASGPAPTRLSTPTPHLVGQRRVLGGRSRPWHRVTWRIFSPIQR